MNISLVIISIFAGIFLGTLSNWLYDLLKDRGVFPTKPTIKHIIVVFVAFLPFVLLVALPQIIESDNPIWLFLIVAVMICVILLFVYGPQINSWINRIRRRTIFLIGSLFGVVLIIGVNIFVMPVILGDQQNNMATQVKTNEIIPSQQPQIPVTQMVAVVTQVAITQVIATNQPPQSPTLSNTLDGSILNVGETWTQDGLGITISNVSLYFSAEQVSYIDLVFTNGTNHAVELNLSGERVGFLSDLDGDPVYMDIGTFSQGIASYTYTKCHLNIIGDSSVLRGKKELIIVVSGIFNIKEARWRVPIE